jgi:hypothetical protein
LFQELAGGASTATAATSTLCKLLAWHEAGAWQAAETADQRPGLLHQADWLASLLTGAARTRLQTLASQEHRRQQHKCCLWWQPVPELICDVCTMQTLFRSLTCDVVWCSLAQCRVQCK